MEIIILSKEIVKPSTPTPPHLRNHKLCIFDQIALEICITPIFFYKNNNNIVDNRLKSSLAETLTLFYPLAGELSSEDSTFVDCNDNGVLYVEACVKDVCMDEFLRNIDDLSQLINFLPQNASMCSKMNYVQTLETLVSIQVTRFDCGGVAIGGVLFHRLLDGDTMSKFFNTWAKIARGDNHNDGVEKITPLDLTSSSLLFPAQNFPQEFMETKKRMFFYEEKPLVRRFVFNAKAIEDIKMKVSSENVPNPSRVEALTTFIWKHMILATRATKGISSRPTMLAHVVNLRSRIDPKLPNAFGNLAFVAKSEVIEMSDHELELPHLLGIVREMLENMNSENLKALEGDDALDSIVYMAIQLGILFPQLDTYNFSSWCNFGLYDVDFGWGKPIFIAPFIEPISSLNMHQIILVENGRNDGIEAWILRSNEEMIELEKDEEFLAYASPNPSVQYDP
nr:acylglucose acyltransferase 1 [Solanum nigrum]